MTSRPRSSSRALAALASPARQELIAALGDGPATVRELAARLARSRQSLYHHTVQLQRAGLVRTAGWRGSGRDRERVFTLVKPEVRLGVRASAPSEVEAGVRATQAILRLTGREVTEALRATRGETAPKHGLIAMRAKVRLGARQLEDLTALVGRIKGLLAQAAGDMNGRVYALTLVLTPARDAAAPARQPRRITRRTK